MFDSAGRLPATAAEVRELKKRIRELERVLGKKTMENEVLTEAVKLAHEKKTDLAHAIAATGRFAMKAIANTMCGALPSILFCSIALLPLIRWWGFIRLIHNLK